MKFRRLFPVCGAIALVVGTPAIGQGDDAVTIQNAALTMQTGDNILRDQGDGEVSILISLPMQMAFIYRDGRLIGASTVSTGRKGKRTPTGDFRILEKQRFHRSNIYSNAPMPFMQRLTWTGIAMHAGHLPGYPASHGCIRFPASFARKLYAITEKGGLVKVTNQVIAAPAGLDFEPAPVPPPEPPILVVSVDSISGPRYNAVTYNRKLAAGPGETVYGPARQVVQPAIGRD